MSGLNNVLDGFPTLPLATNDEIAAARVIVFQRADGSWARSTVAAFLAASGVAVNTTTDVTTIDNDSVAIGSSAATEIGLYGVTPVVQAVPGGVTAGFTAGAGAAVLVDSTFTGNVGDRAYTISDVVAALKNIGVLDTSA